jgi:2'-5' RNA ligase
MKWIYLDVAEKTVAPILDRTWSDEFAEYGYAIEKDPHITLIPGFDDSDVEITMPSIENPQPIKITGYRFWPSIEEPMVVMLDVSNDMTVNIWRDELMEQIDDNKIKYDIAPPHITLFKAGNSGDENSFTIEPEARKKVVEKVSEADMPSHIAMTEVNISDWTI